jgi:ribulose-phosphate 3-epimerase
MDLKPTTITGCSVVYIFPSLIGGDLLALRDQISRLDRYCSGYHLDLMDGHFVPNITLGPSMINAIAAVTRKKVWVHMMVTDPGYWLAQFHLPKGSMVDFHWEVPMDHAALIKKIRDKGWSPGIALSPETPIADLLPLLKSVDHVLVMSVKPGFSGQLFIPESIKKIQNCALLRSSGGYTFKIAIDGGITKQVIHDIVSAGADYIAVASAIFAHKNPEEALKELMDLAQKN